MLLCIFAFEPSLPSSIDFKAMAFAQQSDDAIPLLSQFSNKLKLENITIPLCDYPLLCDISTGVPRSVVPVAFHCQVGFAK